MGQYTTGTCRATETLATIIGYGTQWAANVSLPAIFKIDEDGQPTYSVGAINSATRITLAANYVGSTVSGVGYMICRSFSANRNYWRPLQGDQDFAEILSQETIDKIDTDLSNIMTGNATIVFKSGNLLHTLKKSISVTNLTSASTMQTIKCFRASAGDLINDIIVNLATPFRNSTAASIVKYKIGDLADDDGFGSQNHCGSSESTGYTMIGQGAADKGAYLLNASKNRVNKIYATATAINISFTASRGWLASLDNGAMDIYLCRMAME